MEDDANEARYDARVRMVFMLCVTACVLGIFTFAVLSIYTAYSSDRERDLQRQQTAQHCMDSGGTWIANNCLPKAR